MPHLSSKQWEPIAASLLILCASASVCWALLWPISGNHSAKVVDGGDTGGPRSSIGPELVAMDDSWERSLQHHAPGNQRPVKDVPPANLDASKPALELGISLVGTMIEEGNSYAVVADQSGHVDTQPVGGELNVEPAGIMVKSIEPHRVVVAFQDSTQVLELPSQFSNLSAPAAAATQNEMDDSATPPIFQTLDQELDWLNSPAGSESETGRGVRDGSR